MSIQDLTDEELFQRAQAGDEEAFACLYRRRQAGVYRFALRMSGSAAMAEDVTQEVFLALLRDWRRYNPKRGSVAAYLLGIGRNHVLRRLERDGPQAAETAQAREVTGEFIPLVPDQTWTPGESGQIMRVSMPRTALQSFGLPVDESRAFEIVKADIVVGQDMVARAIRIVR